MNKFIRRTNKLVALVTGVLLTYTLTLIFTANNGISAFSAEVGAALTIESKIYSRAPIDDSNVLIVVAKRFGGINKCFDESFFRVIFLKRPFMI